MSSRDTLTATATGASSAVHLAPGGRWAIAVTSATWGDADLQCSVDGGVTFADVSADNNGSVVNFVANRTIMVMGGLSYRLDVNTYVADIVLQAQFCPS